jgi:hypothetical protein
MSITSGSPPKAEPKAESKAGSKTESKSDEVKLKYNANMDSKELARRAQELRRATLPVRQIEPIDLLQITPNNIADKPPQPMMVRPQELYIDAAYQRDISRSGMRLILDIVANFSWQKYRPPVVTRDEQGRYIVIDGQHTAIGAASHPQIDRIPVSYVQMDSLTAQALAFISHNTAMVRVSAIDLFFAKVTAGDEAALAITDILKRHNVTIARYLPSQGSFDSNQTIAIGRMTMLINKYGPARFDTVIEILSKCNLAPIRADHMAAVAYMLYDEKSANMRYSHELLADMIRSLSDTDSITQASRLAATMDVSKAHALATYWRSRYRDLYSKR